MPSSSVSTPPLYNEQMALHHEPTATETSNGSPKSLASGLSSASSTSSSSTASAEARHKRRLAQSKYHDIDYLKTLANAGLTDGSVNVLSGKQIGEFVGLLSKDPSLRNRTGPVVVARSAVTGGRKIVDYARMWRGDTKAHRNKGPRKDFLEEEFTSARDAQSVIEEALYATVPEDQAVQHDEELKRAVKEFDKAFRRQSVIAEAMPESGPATSPAETKPTTLHKKKSSRHDSTSNTPRQSSKDKALPPPPAAVAPPPQRPKMSATASVQSIPYLGPLNGSSKAHERQLKVANPDSRSPTVASVEDLLESSSKKNRRDLLILLLDDADEEWNMKHPTPAMRRMPTARKSRWDGKLAPPEDTRRSHSYDDQRREGAQHQPIHMPPGDITPPRWSPAMMPSTGSSPMGPSMLEMPGTVFQSQATGTVGYSPGSIYAPPGQGGVMPQYLPTSSMASTMYTPSMASSAYTMSPASTSSGYLMSPPSAAYNGVPLYASSSTVTLSPPGTYPMAMGASPYVTSQPALSPYTTAVPLMQYHY